MCEEHACVTRNLYQGKTSVPSYTVRSQLLCEHDKEVIMWTGTENTHSVFVVWQRETKPTDWQGTRRVSEFAKRNNTKQNKTKQNSKCQIVETSCTF